MLAATHWDRDLVDMGLLDCTVGRLLSYCIVFLEAVYTRWRRARTIFVHYSDSLIRSSADCRAPLTVV